MENRSEFVTDDTRAAEVATVVFQGHEFAAGGFTVDVERGRMIAYVHEDKDWKPGLGHRYSLHTWGGLRIAGLRRTDRGRWYTTTSGQRVNDGSIWAFGAWLMAFETTEPIAGHYWYGRGLGPSMILKLRRGRKAA